MTSGGEPRTLAGRYRLDEVIGRGGMSTVYRGTDLELDRTVAVKVALDPLVEQSPIYLARFTREATAGAAIDHRGVVTVYDAGADGPTRFIVMEFVPGKSLADILREHSPLDPDEAADIAAQAADALSAAHARGIVHRDIKPGNIMLTPDGSVKVLDFGIARAVDGGTLTQTATVLGTSAYMSPEQAMGQPADARSDIYSLGCVLYEMLTGKPPFIADVAAAVMHQHVRVAPKPARERNPEIPPALDALAMEMLAKSPADRPQTAAEVRDRLRQIDGNPGNPGNGEDSPTTLAMASAPPPPPPVIAPEPREARPTAAPAAAAGAGAAASAPAPRTPQPSQARKRSRTGLWATLAVLAALLLGGAVALALNAKNNNSSSTSSGHSTPALTSSHSATTLTNESTSAPQTTSHSTSTNAPTTATSQSTTRSTPATTSSTNTATSGAPTTSTSAATTGANTSTSGGTTP